MPLLNNNFKLITVSVAAKELNVSPDTIIRYFDAGFLSGIEVSHKKRRTIRIYRSSISTFDGKIKY